MNVCLLALMALSNVHSITSFGPQCAGGAVRTLNSIFEPIAIAENDTRFGMHEGGPKYGLTSKEQNRLAQVTGKVLCPRSDGRPLYIGNAAMIGRNDTIVTNAHILLDESGVGKADLEYCVFEPSSRPRVRRRFNLAAIKYGTRKPLLYPDLDYAFVRLEAPISGVEPIPIHEGAGLNKGEQFMVISAKAYRMKPDRRVLEDEPVIQTCAVLEAIRAEGTRGGGIQTSCSGTDGSSGSLAFVRNQRGEFAAIGIHAGGPGPELDGKPPGTTKGSNYSTTLTIEGPFLKQLKSDLHQQTSL